MAGPNFHSIMRNAVLPFCCAAMLLPAEWVFAQKRVFTVAGGAVRDGHAATDAPLSRPQYVARDAQGNLYITDDFAHRVRKINQKGVISTVAGTGISGFTGDNGRAREATVSFPTGIVVDNQGNVLFSDTGNVRVRKVDRSGIITTIAGNGTKGYSGDGGPATTSASMNGPLGLALDSAGNLFIADSGNHVIRKVNAAGIIRTIAGNGTAGFSGDNGQAKKAQLNFPEDVALDDSNVFIADGLNFRVRKVDPRGTITTLAGNGQGGCVGDGGPATQATLGDSQSEWSGDD
jgi:hypothetical protein